MTETFGVVGVAVWGMIHLEGGRPPGMTPAIAQTWHQQATFFSKIGLPETGLDKWFFCFCFRCAFAEITSGHHSTLNRLSLDNREKAPVMAL